MRILLLLSLFFALDAFAREEKRWDYSASGQVDTWILHGEGEKTYVDLFTQKPGDLPDLQETHSYIDPAQAEAEFARVTAGFTNPNLSQNLIQPLASSIPTWKVKQNWDWSWEKKYEEWIRNEVDVHFFERNNISTDCADAAIALRWIFARINGLPSATTLATGVLVSQDSMRPEWTNFPTNADWRLDKRFRAALEFVLRGTYTHTLVGDLYPVKVSQEALIPGAVLLHLYFNDTGHTEIIKELATEPNAPEPIRVMASDVPRAVRVLYEYGMLNATEQPQKDASGLMRFRWPVKTKYGWALLAPTKMPFYSLEQYDPKFMAGSNDFTAAVINRLFPGWSPDFHLTMRARVSQLVERYVMRAQIVEDGFAFCQNNNCRQGTSGWENWSTPSRDSAIDRLVTSVDTLYNEAGCDGPCKMELQSRLYDRLTTVDGTPITLIQAMTAWRSRTYSADPADSVKKRWGIY